MISWIQKYFQRHFKFVFFVILLTVGVPMVVIYSGSSGIGQGGGIKVMERPFFGVNLASQEQQRRVFSDGELSSYLRAGYAAMQGAELQEYSLQRVAGLALADELHLPVPTSADVAKYVPTLRAFQNQEGKFDQSTYTRFADSLKTGGTLTSADVNRVLRDDTRLEALLKLVSGPGYVLPVEVKMQLGQIDSTWTAQVASLDFTSFNPTITPTDEALKKFHADNSFRYDVPVRPRLSYIEFKAADFVPPTEPTEAELRAFYTANISRFPVPAEAGKVDTALPATATDNFPKVRAEVERVIRLAASRHLASQVANELTVALFDRKAAITANSAELTAFLSSQRLTAKPITPFPPAYPPADMPWLGNQAEAIARLNRDRYFSDALPTPDGFAVLLWNESLPAYTPMFTEVRERVSTDFKENERRRLFIERGNALKTQLQAAAKSATGFADLAATEKLEVKTYANFTLAQPPQDMPQPALAALSRLEAGQVSDLVGSGNLGLLVFAQTKKLPDLTTSNPRFGEVKGQLMAFIASGNGDSVLGQLVAAELKKTEAVGAP